MRRDDDQSGGAGEINAEVPDLADFRTERSGSGGGVLGCGVGGGLFGLAEIVEAEDAGGADTGGIEDEVDAA